jgi:prepilin-type N-terminal cleavage/methylation domain-containing protein
VRIEKRYGAQWKSETAKARFAYMRRCAAERGADGASAPSLPSRGFTLIELILVMALLVIAVTYVTPRMQVFFRGRTMQSEARQLVALMHNGQARAVSGGVPMRLWFDSDKKQYGLEEEPGYSDPKDATPEKIDLNENLKIEIPEGDPSLSQPATTELNDEHSGMPKITFLPDGSIADGSPKSVRIVDNDGSAVLLTQTRDRNQYEITTTTQE